MAKNKKPQQQQPQKPQGKCIFCNGHGMTKQHVWPNWISRSEIAAQSKEAQKTDNIQTLHGMGMTYDQEKITVFITPKYPETIVRQGNLLSTKLRMVCAKCNNTWMSAIEENSKEIVLDLQAHKKVDLSVESQKILCQWITLLTIVAEFTDIPNKKIPMSERKKFYEEHNPLPNWHIWVGKYEGVDWDLRYKHQGYSLVVEGQKDTSKPSEQLITMGVQSSIFVIGGLLILVFSSNDENARAFLENYRINFLNKIWPPTGTELVWKETGVNNDEGTLFLSDLLLRDMQKMHIDLMKLLDEKKANKNA